MEVSQSLEIVKMYWWVAVVNLEGRPALGRIVYPIIFSQIGMHLLVPFTMKKYMDNLSFELQFLPLFY